MPSEELRAAGPIELLVLKPSGLLLNFPSAGAQGFPGPLPTCKSHPNWYANSLGAPRCVTHLGRGLGAETQSPGLPAEPHSRPPSHPGKETARDSSGKCQWKRNAASREAVESKCLLKKSKSGHWRMVILEGFNSPASHGDDTLLLQDPWESLSQVLTERQYSHPGEAHASKTEGAGKSKRSQTA